MSENRFIPVRYRELADALFEVCGASRGPHASFDRVADGIRDVIHQEAAAFEARLADAYAPFNPDRDTLTRQQLDPEDRAAALQRLTTALRYLFGKANFEPVTEPELRAALAEANTQGLTLKLDEAKVDRIMLFFRGCGSVARKERSWRTRFRAREVDTPVYRRFAVVVKLRDDPALYLKLFKNIPRVDIEALLPHAQVSMNLFDRIKLAGSGAGALGSTLSKLFLGAVVWSRLLLLIAGGLVMLAIRTFTGYRTIRTQRDALRTRNLYFQNLDNNAGVIHALIAMVCEEEAKEALLAYGTCLSCNATIRDAADLDARVEAFLGQHFGAAMNFEITDAIETLTRLRLLADPATLTVLEPDSAADRLAEHWRGRHTQDYHERTSGVTWA